MAITPSTTPYADAVRAAAADGNSDNWRRYLARTLWHANYRTRARDAHFRDCDVMLGNECLLNSGDRIVRDSMLAHDAARPVGLAL